MTSGRAAIEADQLAKLRALLDTILPSNRFYASKLAGLEIASLQDFTARVPFTGKQELIDDQGAHPPYGSNLTYPLAAYPRFSQTSATSTGRPLRWLDTAESWRWMLGNWKRVFQAADVTGADRIFFAFSFGPFLGFWTAFEAAAEMGCLCLPGGGLGSAARLQSILDNQATVLCCTPTYAMHLAEVAAEQGIDLKRSRLRRIVVAGEPGGSVEATRRHIESQWPGARVADHHGMTEVGPVTYSCPAHPGVLHVIESSYIAEVVEGELVLTNLGRAGSPLIRYRTGDLVKPAPPGQCACGTWDMALEGGILCRNDDMVVIRGVNVFPGAVEEILRSAGGVAEYRVHLTNERSLAELRIEVEPDHTSPDAATLSRRIASAFREALALRVPVAVVERGTLPRFELKAKRWVRNA